jgi:hypothetical protein
VEVTVKKKEEVIPLLEGWLNKEIIEAEEEKEEEKKISNMESTYSYSDQTISDSIIPEATTSDVQESTNEITGEEVNISFEVPNPVTEVPNPVTEVPNPVPHPILEKIKFFFNIDDVVLDKITSELEKYLLMYDTRLSYFSKNDRYSTLRKKFSKEIFLVMSIINKYFSKKHTVVETEKIEIDRVIILKYMTYPKNLEEVPQTEPKNIFLHVCYLILYLLSLRENFQNKCILGYEQNGEVIIVGSE